MRPLNFGRLKSIISRFSEVKVLVIGDLILDEFIWGTVNRVSPEAPVPVVWVNSESFMPGGASNVANNMRTLGAQVYLAGLVGDDPRGDILTSLLRTQGVHCDGIQPDKQRPTTLKTRVIAHHQQVVRIDREALRPITDNELKKMIEYVHVRIQQVDAVCLEDYGKGVVVPRLVQETVRIAKRYKKVITVDPKETHISYYKGVTTITPNHHEAGAAVGFAIKDDRTLEMAGQKLLKKLNCESVLITLGENGMSLFQKGKKKIKINTMAQDVFDVSGAGDTVISAYTLARAAGATPLESAHISNCAAGIVVGKVGVAVTNADELLERMKQQKGL